jgi:type IV secretion system protein VirB2
MTGYKLIPLQNRPTDAQRRGRVTVVHLASLVLTLATPALCLAQASPFQTGATALQTNLLTLLTPVAIILVIALGVGAMVNRISWAWCIAAIAGIALSFGAPQIVTWIRGMFAV